MRNSRRGKVNISSEILNEVVQAVEEQINSESTIYVKECYERLRGAGDTEKSAKEKIAEKLLKEADYIHTNKSEFSEERYKKDLEELF